MADQAQAGVVLLTEDQAAVEVVLPMEDHHLVHEAAAPLAGLPQVAQEVAVLRVAALHLEAEEVDDIIEKHLI